LKSVPPLAARNFCSFAVRRPIQCKNVRKEFTKSAIGRGCGNLADALTTLIGRSFH
jgi:hypothetical protein